MSTTTKSAGTMRMASSVNCQLTRTSTRTIPTRVRMLASRSTSPSLTSFSMSATLPAMPGQGEVLQMGKELLAQAGAQVLADDRGQVELHIGRAGAQQAQHHQQGRGKQDDRKRRTRAARGGGELIEEAKNEPRKG